jgi:sulfotransferase 6B1
MSYQLKNVLRLHARDFCFQARALRAKLNSRGPKNLIICNSYPKSGTHLLYQILYSVSDFKKWDDIVAVQALCGIMNTADHIRWKIGSAPEKSIIRAHLMCCDEIIEIFQEHSCKNFFIYRDPRDIAVSHARWVTKEPKFFLHDIYRRQSGFDEHLMSSIKGVPMGTPFGSNVAQPNIGQDFSRWKGWISQPDTMAIKFEDLVGERGGGSEQTRLDLIEKIMDILEVNLSPFVKGGKGSIGGWQSVFKEEHKAAFKSVAGDLLIELGYESTLDW